MPTIAQFAESKNAFPDAPPSTDVGPERFGRNSEALGQVGNALGQFGSNLMEARKKAEESDAVANASHEDIIWMSQLENQMRLQYQSNPGGAQSPSAAPSPSPPGPMPPFDPSQPAPQRGPSSQGGMIITPDGDTLQASDAPDRGWNKPASILANDATVTYDVRGFADNYKKSLEDRMKQRLKEMPTGDSQRAYRDKMSRIFDSAYVENLNWENLTTAKNYLENVQQRFAQGAQYLYRNPSIDDTNRLLDNMRDDLNSKIGTVISPDDAQKLYKTYARQYVMTYFDGLANSKQGIDAGLALINNISEYAPVDKQGNIIAQDQRPMLYNGEKGGIQKIDFGYGKDPTTIRGVLLPTDLSDLETKLRNAQGVQTNKDIARIKARMNDRESALMNAPVSEWNKYFSTEQTIADLDMLHAYANDPKSPVDHAEINRMRNTISYGMVINGMRDKLFQFSPADKGKWDQMMDAEWQIQLKNITPEGEAVDPSFAYAGKAQFDHLKEVTWNRVMDERKKDPAGYVEKYFGQDWGRSGNFPSADRLTKRLQMQAQLGMQKTTLLTDQERSMLKGSLKQNADQSPEAAAMTLEGIKSKMGRYASRVMDELGGDEYFKTAFNMASPDAAASVIGNSKFRKELEGGFTDRFGKDAVKDMDETLGKNMQNRYDAFAGAGQYAKNMKFANGLKDAVRMEAMRMMTTNGLDQDQALAEAQKKIIDNHYAIVGKTFVPRQVGDVPINMQYIEGQMQKGFDPEWVAGQGVNVPKGIMEKDPKVAANSFRLAVQNGRWVTEPSGLKARFEVKLKNGAYVPVTKKDGTPLSIDFAETSVNPSKEAVDYNKPFFDKLLGK